MVKSQKSLGQLSQQDVHIEMIDIKNRDLGGDKRAGSAKGSFEDAMRFSDNELADHGTNPQSKPTTGKKD
jgi:hypothetical protein